MVTDRQISTESASERPEAKYQPDTLDRAPRPLDSSQATCRDCNAPIENASLTLHLLGKTFVLAAQVCNKCSENYEKRVAIDEAKTRFYKICPPEYRQSDPTRLPPAVWAQVRKWRPTTPGHGLVIWGDTEHFKTRMMWQLIKRLIIAGHGMRAITGKEFANWAQLKFQNPEFVRSLESVKKCKMLFVDDLGKETLTETIQAEWFDLVERRTSHHLTTLWTLNASSEELGRRFSSDRRAPFLRRMSEFHHHIKA